MSLTELSKVEPLRLGNFPEWEGAVSALLRYKNYYNTIDGTYVKPVVPALTTGNTDEVKERRDELRDWKGDNAQAAGLIALTLSVTERTALREHLNDGVALWAAIKARHVRDQPASRYNSYIELMSMELKDGEPLAAFDARVHDVMRRVKLHRPTAFTLADLDKELISMVVLRGLSRHTSCSVLVSTLLHSDTLSDVDKLSTELAAEDMNRQAAPAMYGLAADAEGVLCASAAPAPATAAAASATTNSKSSRRRGRGGATGDASSSATSSSDSSAPRKCDYCSGNHLTDACFKKQIAELRNLVRGQGARTATAYTPASESAGSATEACFVASDAQSDGADVTWIVDTGATSHMTPNRTLFASYSPLRTPVRLADGNIIMSAGVGVQNCKRERTTVSVYKTMEGE